ncbi:GvpL/GvpF family gas vesicle protein [Streptomyces radicis]|uniref:Gas vesicle protein n=1 Tax=Streptomyces radicis TaxID=1750517 RepID=A0A3A9WNP8_9ACTN|nr:GvpL/GvpF family gas vesicle protein [Streptomyces radicis]RKN09366.1 gas vesicle protein [Streptomyces radicis]RKN23036.1 gas vesicle protein [Streptomyces radicis]
MAGAHVYVYGIIRAGHELPPGRQGVGSPPARLRKLCERSLAAVVSEAPDSLLARRRDLLAHQETLLALADEGPVLPMRFGVVSPDESAVAKRLAEGEQEHLDTLERLAGRLEMNLKVFSVEDGLADLVREDATVRRLREAAQRRPGYEASVRLGEAVAAGLQRRAAAAAAEALRLLTPLSEATAPGPDVPGCVRNISFLVPRHAVDAFRSEATRCATRLVSHAEVRVSGPLPCFSFVPAATHDGAPAAAGH